jgi:hypothetical protein
LFLFSFVSSGCVPLIVGGAGVLGGYAISKDTIQGETDKDYNTLWNAVKTVAKIKGTIKTEDKTKGYLELTVDSSRVVVQLSRLTKTANRLRVSARRMGLPNIDLAQDIFVKILEQAS